VQIQYEPGNIPDADVLSWYATTEGANWLETASYFELSGRQLWLIRNPSATSELEYALLEYEIRGSDWELTISHGLAGVQRNKKETKHG
jgi:hypothetical protein